MTNDKGYTISISRRFEGWWRYNAALMCGCFDAEERRVDFAAVESHVADVGTGSRIRPAGIAADRSVTLAAPPCDHLILYIYLIPHTLPENNDIDASRPFEVDLRITFAGKKLRAERLRINQWSGASIEMRVEAPR